MSNKVTFAHCKKFRFCKGGVEAFCARNGLDFEKLKSPGLEYSELERLGDYYADRLVALARRMSGG